MTIDEAIRRNRVLMAAPVLKDDPKVVETFELNIEALKRIRDMRISPVLSYYNRLPGETK